ncbi:unnamed protein product [Chilo suppressalis]|uniref:Uncharacterized protein n=1 Tax=Chilo suppressalis TaxID=168631 RepID=A0ABN8AWZ7_CHISP|nr:unnamed protein product [Chilo suppressalis]
MKLYIALLLAAVAVVECGHTFVGTNVMRPQVYHSNVYYSSLVFRKRIENLYYVLPTLPANAGRVIQLNKLDTVLITRLFTPGNTLRHFSMPQGRMLQKLKMSQIVTGIVWHSNTLRHHDLYSVTGFRFRDGEILEGPQAENWRVPLEVLQADVISSRGKSLRLEPLDYSNLRGTAQLEGGVLAYDLSNSDATANITQGGIGYNYVNLRMKSSRGKSIKFDVYIYA